MESDLKSYTVEQLIFAGLVCRCCFHSFDWHTFAGCVFCALVENKQCKGDQGNEA